jgi:hypothetical protein
MQGISNRLGTCLPIGLAFFRAFVADIAFDIVEFTKVLQGALRDLAFVGHMQIEELAPGMHQAADFGHALLEPGFISGKMSVFVNVLVA